MIKDFKDVQEEAACQQACAVVNECQYYVWNSKTHFCQILDSKNKTCDALIGPKSPSFDSCNHVSINSNNSKNNIPKMRQQHFMKRRNYKNIKNAPKFLNQKD